MANFAKFDSCLPEERLHLAQNWLAFDLARRAEVKVALHSIKAHEHLNSVH
jgi:hypothetical protein